MNIFLTKEVNKEEKKVVYTRMYMDITDFQEYTDQFGFLHNVKNPTTLSTENPLFITGTFFVLAPYSEENRYELIRLNDFISQDGRYRTTIYSPIERGISHDDATAWMSALYVYGLHDEVKKFKLTFPRNYRPWDLLYYMALKFKFKKVPIITKLFCYISMAQGHKRFSNGVVMAKTEGKILALIKGVTLGDGEFLENLKLLLDDKHCKPLPDHNKLVVQFNDGKWMWGSWKNIFLDYYRMDREHPDVMVASQY